MLTYQTTLQLVKRAAGFQPDFAIIGGDNGTKYFVLFDFIWYIY